ncbi:NERD domain-containing protein [Halobacillus halophilus]|uniref:NERD domain-containing protein n=1 Tax=Halobacillus halophilus TaxID=1570 RepID=UPI001CD52126|nr:NERD domain-containing protein [Halobacillus halophilus]MCA1009982.1 NERD domain-containing protein [Halobacillus halophilus]
MGQLIKLLDYISRYETDIFQYSRQFIELKKENWNKTKRAFEQGRLEKKEEKEIEPEKKPQLGWRRLLSRLKGNEKHEKELLIKNETPPLETIQEVKQNFLNELISFQLQWASTTVQEKSFLDRTYQKDEKLKFFLQRFPDTYFIMYHPVVKVRKATMESEVILIGPLGIEIITYLELPGSENILPSSDHSWHALNKEGSYKVMNPLLSLKRTETFVKSVLKTYEIEFPLRKVVLAPDLTFHSFQEPYDTDFVDKQRYEEWMYNKRSITSPLKHKQLKTAEALLKHCQTTSFKRPAWDTEEEVKEEG